MEKNKNSQTSTNTNFIYKKIDSPLSAFNNITNEIVKEISDIFYNKISKDFTKKHKGNLLAAESQIMFVDESVYMLNMIKLTYDYKDNDIIVSILPRQLKRNDLRYVNILYENFDRISILFYRYIQMYNLIAKNFDAVPNALVLDIIHNIKSKKFDRTFLLPFKNKLTKIDNLLLSDKYDKFELIIQFCDYPKSEKFKYNIWKCLSSDLDENLNIENLRYIEKELIRSGEIFLINIEEFVKQLFHYGNLLDNSRKI